MAANSSLRRHPLSPLRRYRTSVVLGADACRAGWVGVLLGGEHGRPWVCVAPTFPALVAEASHRGSLDIVAVDMPIGLPDYSRRQADILARSRLGPRRSSVFMTPTRAALAEVTHARASAVNRTTAGEGISTQAFNLKPKLEEVEELAFARAYRIVEVHPEVSSAQLADGPLPLSKRTPVGQRMRRDLLRKNGIRLLGVDEVGAGVGVDDVLDAAVAAWSGRRVLAGEAALLPDPPQVFSDGWAAAIWV
jgi:predicted RNase H-like nuclease